MGNELTRSAAQAAPAGIRTPRRKTFLPVVLRVRDTCYRAHMLNLSTGGANLHSVCSMRIGNEVAIDLADRVLEGRVSWIAGDRFGVRFTRPLNEADVDAIVG